MQRPYNIRAHCIKCFITSDLAYMSTKYPIEGVKSNRNAVVLMEIYNEAAWFMIIWLVTREEELGEGRATWLSQIFIDKIDETIHLGPGKYKFDDAYSWWPHLPIWFTLLCPWVIYGEAAWFMLHRIIFNILRICFSNNTLSLQLSKNELCPN